MLTSMVKRVDNAISTAFKAASTGSFQGGTISMGLKEGGVDWALDEHNRSLITPEMEAKVNAVKQDIIDGKIKVTCQ
jgi:basic membrane protein A